MTRRAKPPAPAGATNAGVTRASLLLLALLVAFCGVTRWGRTYPRFASGSWRAMQMARGMSTEARFVALYDDTFPLLLYLREYLPPDAKVLLPPVDFIRRKHGGDIPLFASPTSTYSFIYPRVPVHFGKPSPFKDGITHVLVWEHWGLEYVAPNDRPTEANRVLLTEWPADARVSW